METEPRFFTLCTFILLATMGASSHVLGADAGDREAYYKKLAAVSPRDSQAYYELARWCQERRLDQEARALLERVIAIDPDHAEARKALGYVRYGLGWRLARETTQGTSRPSKTSALNGVTETERPRVLPDAKSVDAKRAEREALVASKKSWAAEAERKASVKLNTYEDRDLLVHTSFEISSRQVRSFLSSIKGIKQQIQRLLGVRTRQLIWPEKIQFFFLKTIECAQFADKVLSRKFSESKGWEIIDDHRLLVSKIDEDALAHFMGRTSLRSLGNSDGWVIWWLEEGVGELVAANTQAGIEKELGRRHHQSIAAEIRLDPEAYLLKDLLDNPRMERRNRQRSRSLAMTFVDFLASTNRRGFTRFLSGLDELGGEKAGADEDSPEFRKFLIDYLGGQEALFKTHFRMSRDQLEPKWKAFVLAREKG